MAVIIKFNGGFIRISSKGLEAWKNGKQVEFYRIEDILKAIIGNDIVVDLRQSVSKYAKQNVKAKSTKTVASNNKATRRVKAGAKARAQQVVQKQRQSDEYFER